MFCQCATSEDEAAGHVSKGILRTNSHETSSCTTSSDGEFLNTPYKFATPLFRSIEKEDWESVLLFLTHGKWAKVFLTSSNLHLKSPKPEIQVKTWVTAYDSKGEPEWSQLPLHAALSYQAPLVIVQKLVELYPKSVQCTDNEGMLPIHLAFGFSAPESVLLLLLEAFPSALNERGIGGRFPYECCELGPNKQRGEVFKIVAEEVRQRTREEMELEWRTAVTSGTKNLGLDKSMDITNKELTEVILDLMKDRKELILLKKKQAKNKSLAKDAASSSKSAATPQKPFWNNKQKGRKYNV